MEVHPALALQVALGSALLEQKIVDNGHAHVDEDQSWKLSGNKSYKKISWGRAKSKEKKSGFAHLWEVSQNAYGDGNDTSPNLPSPEYGVNKKGQPGPSDHLNAWIAMRLGVLWLQGDGVELYGNRNMGSFLLPAIERAALLE